MNNPWNYFGEGNYPKYGAKIVIIWSDNSEGEFVWWMSDEERICTDMKCYPIAWKYAEEKGFPKVAWLKLYLNPLTKVTEREIALVKNVNNLSLDENYLFNSNGEIVGFVVYFDE